MYTPLAGMRGRAVAGLVSHTSVTSVIANVWRAATGVPIQKKARPSVMMHGYGAAGIRNGYFQHSHQFIFEDDPVTAGSGLDGIVSVREIGFTLPVKIKMRSEEAKRTAGDNGYSPAPTPIKFLKTIHDREL